MRRKTGPEMTAGYRTTFTGDLGPELPTHLMSAIDPHALSAHNDGSELADAIDPTPERAAASAVSGMGGRPSPVTSCSASSSRSKRYDLLGRALC